MVQEAPLETMSGLWQPGLSLTPAADIRVASLDGPVSTTFLAPAASNCGGFVGQG